MSNRYDSVVKKYRLFELTFIDAEVNGKKVGQGKLMSPETLQQFVDGDPSGNCKYLDWMLFMAGGGQEAMEKALQLWQGESADDPNSLRNLCQKDFITEQVQGYTDEGGVYRPPVTKEQAQAAWEACEERTKFEFLMGDQDVAMEDGYGFYRDWPGKDRHYEKILNAVRLWHNAQPKLLARNQQFARAGRLRSVTRAQWTDDDISFMAKFSENPIQEAIELDIYSGWKPGEYSQAGARYKTVAALLGQMSDIRKMQILKDDRHQVIFEDAIVRVICPLTMGASLKFGCSKWCISNRSDFDRSFDNKSPSNGHWKSYGDKGPLVFMCFKVPMPAWCHKVAIHIGKEELCHLDRKLYELPWFDTQNSPGGSVRCADFLKRVETEYMRSYTDVRQLNQDDMALAMGGRPAERAWNKPEGSHDILASIGQALDAVGRWGKTFDQRRLVVDYLSDAGPS